ncbi:2-dehydropantoate 2-reductase N-terminal domain-containing protein [Bradyrhizobium sp.]|uniref:ketopantoate reductase family protein n=1 Tax=Bradyrhizobium sp. TaxID=376 RepID=UPI001D75E12D|nr:2-dehydropantoate 2-reductase N-terminal domain-containing protein [Bradyrhizobium sp.]MBI5320467.1 ketopantoate reductase family protein [Bradyrhizobium sp.]
MKILIVGAGVIGTLYGGRLALAGHEATVLARGERLAQIAAHGLVLEDALSGDRRVIPVAVVSALPAAVRFDLVLVAVRDRQLPGALSWLDALQGRPEILFMLNCPLRVAELVARYGIDRTIFGFPGAGGVHVGASTRYANARQQPTTFGPVAGQGQERVKEIARLFRQAGFATAVVADMDAWLKTHAFLVVAICGALYASGGRSAQLAADTQRLLLLADALREGLSCVRALGLVPSPPRLRLMAKWLPKPLLLIVLRRFFASDLAALVIDGHANAASDDMRDLAADCRRMIAEAGVPAPTVSTLCREVEQRATLAAAA